MKIELKHLAPYLPYGLKIKCINFPIGDGIRTFELDCGHDIHFYLSQGWVKPILRPLSDVYKNIERVTHANILYRRFDITDLLFNGHCENPKYGYEVYTYLLEYHFDVFNLIEQGLAIDINTL